MQCVAVWVSMYAVALLSSQHYQKCTAGYFANTQAAPVAVALLPSHFSFHLQNLLLWQWLVCRHRSNSSGIFYCSCNGKIVSLQYRSNSSGLFSSCSDGKRAIAAGSASIMAKELFLVAMCDICVVLAKETRHHRSNSSGTFFGST